MNKIYGLLRIRNEELIIQDTLNHLAEFCKGVFVYDDCSDDNSFEICKNHPIVKSIIKGKIWDSNRERAEFQNRQAILEEAKRFADENDWFVYIDADERIEFNWEKLFEYGDDVIAVRMKLFDFYITPEDVNKKYYEREWIGPEYREIIMLFRNSEYLRYESPDQREVTLGRKGIIINEGYVKHYGKAISIDAWEKKCDYYANYFPKYSEKWLKRKGKAIHIKSDFGYDLIKWHEKDIKGFPLTPEVEKSVEIKMLKKLNILLSTHHLLDYTGSEIFTYIIAEKLKSKGHNIVVYSPYLDKTAEMLKEAGFFVVDNLEAVKNNKFDIAHVHHNIIALEVRNYFQSIPIVYLSHGILPFLEQPPIINLGISKYLAVSEEVEKNLIAQGINKNLIQIFRNMVDDEKFSTRTEINKIPQKVLVISGRIDSSKEQIIKNVCSELNLQIQFVGGRFGEVTQDQLINLIEESDIVFSLGRGAIESMMMERAVIIYDYLGGDGMVTLENFNEIMKCNFSGRRYALEYDEDSLKNELTKYDPHKVKELRLEAIKNFSAKRLVNNLINIYQECISNPIPQINEYDKKLIYYFVESIKETRNYSYEVIRRKNKQYIEIINNFPNNIYNECADSIIKAESLIEKGNLEEAKLLLNKLVSLNPSNIDALNDLAVVEILENNYSQALDYLKRILSINPTSEVALENLRYLKEKVNEVANLNSNDIIINEKYEKIICPFCQNKDSIQYRTSADIVKCKNCDTVYLRTRLTMEEMNKLYQSYADDGSHMALPKNEYEIKNSPLRRDYFLNEILEFTEPYGVLLDIGCGWGAFLDNARKKGFIPRGIELTKKCVQFANNILDIKVTDDYFENSFFETESITVVTMNHVLEHMPFPKLTLKKIYDILKLNGLFAGIVPNIESYCSQILKENWYWLDPNYHYIHYSPHTLKKHLENNGFEILRLYTATGDYGRDNVIKVIMEKEKLDYNLSAEKLKLIESSLMGEEIRFIARKRNNYER